MNLNIWSKTIVSVYPYLGRVIGATDKLVDRVVKNSSISHSSFFESNSCFAVANRILDLTEKKIAIINLKLLTEKILLEIDRPLARIIIKKYVDGWKNEDIYTHYNLPKRTFYRKLKNAINSFEKALYRNGYDEEKLSTMLKGQKWIYDVYDRIDFEEQKTTSENICAENYGESYFLNLCNKFANISLFN